MKQLVVVSATLQLVAKFWMQSVLGNEAGGGDPEGRQ